MEAIIQVAQALMSSTRFFKFFANSMATTRAGSATWPEAIHKAIQTVRYVGPFEPMSWAVIPMYVR